MEAELDFATTMYKICKPRRSRQSFVLVPVVCCAMASVPTMNSAAGQPRAGTRTVSGSAIRIPSVCGGRQPPDRIDRPTAAVPYPSKKFHVIKGSTNTRSREVLLSFTSDSSGRFSFRVPTGVYSILLDEQAQPAEASRYESRFVKMDAACFAAWWAKPYYDLRVGNADVENLKFEFAQRCFVDHDIPCLHYDGPLPQGER